jgi:tetratricopeptide (TPR) repeat protein
MRPAAHFLSLATLTALLVPALEVTATATQYPEFFDATRLHRPLEIVSSAEVPPTVTIPQYLAQVEGSQSDTVRLFERALEQFNRSQFREAIVTWEQVLNLVRDTNNRNAEGIVLNVLGEAYFRLSQYEQAIGLHEEALEISREVDDRTQEGGALMNLGNVYLGLGEFQEAINFYQQALTVYSEIGDYRREGTALGNLGNAYRNLAQYERAIEFSEQHLAIAQNVGDRAGEGRPGQFGHCLRQA